LITGGLGGFGLAVGRELARKGARSLVLVSRRVPDARRAADVEALRARGVDVLVASADVSRREDVARLLDEARRDRPPLRGIVHGAMVLDDAPLSELEWPRVERVLAPKMAGAWELHRATAGEPLDFFVLFSSIAALLGNPLQGSYAAA